MLLADPEVTLDAELTIDETVDLAFDRSMRAKDQDGHMHVEEVNISKANVCPYAGNEINNWQALGLQSDKVYMLYRHAAELEAAAPTFENKQLMIKHVGVNAERPHEYETVGVVSGVHWSPPYLKARLSIWNQKGIDAVESKAQSELSSGYRYVADMTPGTVDGVPYDGIMRNIRGNHVALVSEGRAGPDVFVTDEFPQEFHTMKASLLASALIASLGLDKKPEDVTTAIASAIANDKKAKDEEKPAKDPANCEAEDKAAADKAAADKAAADKAAADKKAKDEDPDAEVDAEDAEKADPSKGRKPEGGAPNPAADKAAMDAAIATARADGQKAALALIDARTDVKTLLGEVQYDSAEAVYKAALDHLKVDAADIHPSAFRALYRASVSKSSPASAHDAATVKTMDQAFPHLSRLRR